MLDATSDAGSDGVLSPAEVWIYTASGAALDLVDPANAAVVVDGCGDVPGEGSPVRDTYENIGMVVVPGGSDSDPSHYCNPLGSIGDRVWEDLNADGIQDDGEPGIAGVQVKLLDENLVEIASTTTDADGNYLFSNLAAGTYSVVFVNPDSGVWTFSPQDAGSDDTVDSDADPVDGSTALIVLAAGESQLQWDAGVFEPAALGDRVWLDEGSGVPANDANGIQDDGEAGVSGVVVRLLDQDLVEVASTTTDADGNYLFDGLTPGVYVVEFVKPANTGLTAANQGGDDAVDSDADLVTGRTAAITLVSGQTDLTWDAGIVTPSIDIEKLTNGNQADRRPALMCP